MPSVAKKVREERRAKCRREGKRKSETA